jgi:hypothetical protein
MSKVKIDNIVFCDHIRQEIGGKHTLLGVYAPELNIASFPAMIQVAIWMSVTPNKTGPFECEIRIKNPEQKEILNGKIQGEFKILAKTSLALPDMPIQITTAGDYSFNIKFSDEKKWEKISSIKINHTPPVAITNFTKDT